MSGGWLMTQPTHCSSGVALWVVKKPEIFSSDKNFTLASLKNSNSLIFLPGYNFSKIFKMWNNEDTLGFDAKPKVERLGFLSHSESFGYCKSQMSFLNDDTDYEIKEDFKQDAFSSKVDPYCVPPGDVETKTIVDVPLVNDDDDTNSRVHNSGEIHDTNVIQKRVDQNDEVEITLEVNDLEKLVDNSLDYDGKTVPDIPIPNESNESKNEEIDSVNQDGEGNLKQDEVAQKKRKKSTYKKKWPEDPADCDICGTHYTTKRSYQRHYRIVHELISYNCKHCGQQFKWPDKLKAHINLVHLGIKKKTHPCDKCDKVMTEARSLRDHKAREHPPPGCESCKLSFQDVEGLQEHIRVEHLQKYCNN